MKKVLLFVLSGCMIASVGAQDVETESYTITGGLLGAANLSKFSVSGANSSSVEYDTKTGFSLGGWVNFPVSDAFSIEPQLMYSSYRYMTNATTPVLLADGKIGYVSLPLLLKFHLGDKVAIPVGPQVDFLTSVDDESNTAVKDDFKGTTFSLFGGVEIFPHGRVTIFGRYIHGLSNLDEGGDHVSGLEYKNRNIQLGLKVRLFGGKKEAPLQATDVIPDSDGDGINDQLDKCPNEPGLAKYDGCPIPDSDGDGINDELYKCPTVAGLAKYEGCPIPDSDGDGINDELDKCPNQAGLAKYDGCPAPDRDGDGIADDEDDCPDVAGTAANDGCPALPANVSKTLGAAAMNVGFGSRNATLTTRSYAALDQIVKLMKENPGLDLEIGAHTDNVGDDDANEELSEARAEAVKAYLVSKGIDEDRIDAEGYGESRPIADNNTAAGRARNNRIEFKIED